MCAFRVLRNAAEYLFTVVGWSSSQLSVSQIHMALETIVQAWHIMGAIFGCALALQAASE